MSASGSSEVPPSVDGSADLGDSSVPLDNQVVEECGDKSEVEPPLNGKDSDQDAPVPMVTEDEMLADKVEMNEEETPQPEVSEEVPVVEGESATVEANAEPAAQGTYLQYLAYDFSKIVQIKSTENLFPPEDYLDSCKWAPDGTCLLTCCADQKLRLFDLPEPIYKTNSWDGESSLEGQWSPSLVVSERGSIYDFDWYPHMSSWSPETACVFEIASCYGLIFTLDGNKLYCGYRNMIKMFDISVPGTTCQTINTKKLNEQTGLISCLAQNPVLPCLFAAGSFSRTIGLYTSDGDAVCILKGQKNGLTSLTYSSDGTKLFSGSRVDPEILCWDLRNPGDVLHVFPRVMETNQRIRVSLSVDGKYLVTGGTDGEVRIWNLNDAFKEPSPCEPTYKFKAHNDCVNGASLNSKHPVMATTSGKRHTADIVSDDESDQFFTYKNFPKKTENRVTLWWVGPQKEDEK